MYMMPRSLPQINKQFAALSILVLSVLVLLAGIDASAQGRRRRPVTAPKTQQQGTANTSTPQPKPQQKKITPLRSSETADGSRITIRADAPLNDYSAYRSGDRYYVVIPEASAPAAQGGMKGRGFEDVQVQKRGGDTVLSFKLQPGTNARVSQKFDKLDVELTTPGKRGANPTGATVTSATPTATPATTQPTPHQTPASTQITPSTGIANQAISTPQATSPNSNRPFGNSPVAGENPTVVYAPTPELPTSSASTTEASPAVTPAAEEVAQAQPVPAQQQPITTSAPSTSTGTTFGAVLQQNWLIILIGALVLASLVMIVAARSRAQRAATTAPARRTRRERKRAATGKAVEELPEADTSSAITAASAATPVASVQPEVDVEAVATGIVAAKAASVEPEEMPLAVEEDETKEIEVASAVDEVAPAVDAERIDVEVKNVLAGESYDESVIGATDAGTRQLVATELLSALAARNVERRERAREVFIKHDYLDEATKNLRTADAPAERAAAARALGYVKDKSTTPHLIAALEDEAPEVRRASVEALADLRDPSAAEPLKALLASERDRKVPKNLIKSAIDASVLVEEEETPTLEAATSTPETATPTLEAATSTLEAETPTLEAETSPVATADVAPTDAASELIAAAPSVIEEVETTEDADAARQQAEAQRQAEAERLAEEESRRKAEDERLRLEAETRQRAEEEARQEEAKRQAEAARVRAEEEARQREEARRREEAQRLEEEERRQAAEAARLKAEEDAARQRAEEEESRRQAEAERLRLEEDARLRAQEEARAEEEARRRADEEARQRAEEEARLAVEAGRRAEEEEARRLAAEEAAANIRAEEISPVEISDEAVMIESTSAPPLEPLIERNDGTAADWIELDMNEASVVSHPEPVIATPVDESAAQLPLSMEAVEADAAVEQSKELEPTSFSIVGETKTKEIDYAVTEKGIASLDEYSTVPAIILKRLSSEEPTERAAAVTDLARVGGEDSFREISASFDDPAVEVRNAAARSLFELNSARAETFTRALREAPPERRRKIGAALASSGLASEAISQLMGESREKTYDAFSLLFLMSKAGEVQPLMRAIEEHPNNEVRLAVVKLLALSGQQEILPAFRRLAVRGSLPTEVRSAVMEAIYQISSQSPTAA
jgi:HEAT repeat protein